MNKSEIEKEIYKVGFESIDAYKQYLNEVVHKKYYNLKNDWQTIKQKYRLRISAESIKKANINVLGGAFIMEFLKNFGGDINCDVQADEMIDNVSEQKMNKDGTFTSQRLIMMNETESKDPDYILNAHGFDPSAWKLVSVRNVIRQAMSRYLSQFDDDGKPIYDSDVRTLYSSFITVKPYDEKELPLQRIGEFFDNLDREYSLPATKEVTNIYNGDKLLLIDIADLHLNLQASIFTTGNEYNCDIAEDLFFYVINSILTRTKNYRFEKIIFCIGGDMLNGDNLSGSTTKGTPQVSDVHYYDAYERLCAMTIKAIDILKEYGKVDVLYVMGNHDELAGYKLSKFIDAWFRNDSNVEVDYQPIARKYRLYGKTLMGFMHNGNIKKLPSIVAYEAREYWSKAESTDIFLQHLHKEEVLLEENNIRIQRLPTISAKSKWSADKGYNSKRQCKAFVYDREDGLTDVIYIPIKK